MARPCKEVNWEEFDKLCAIQCTQVEIANWFECSVDTIERAVKRTKKMSYAEFFAQKADKGKISLRRQQWQLALKGDRTMLIWLGKQHLGQTDRAAHELSGPGGKPIETLDVKELTDEQLEAKIAEKLEKRTKYKSTVTDGDPLEAQIEQKLAKRNSRKIKD